MRSGALALIGAALLMPQGVQAKPAKGKRMLERGLALLDKGDSASICRGAKLLAKSGQEEAVEPLLKHVRSRNEGVRDCVTEALDDLTVTPQVVRARWDATKDVDARESLLAGVVGLSHAALVPLYEVAAAARSAELRRLVAVGLKHHRTHASTPGLLRQLVADADEDVRWWAVDTLSLMGTDDARTILRERLGAERNKRIVPFIRRALGLPDD